VILDVRTNPSSRMSGRTMELDRSLFIIWHRTKPSRNVSQNNRLSRSSAAALSPLEVNPPTVLRLLELALPADPLFPHIFSSLTSLCVRTSTSSHSLIADSVRPICMAGFTSSLHSIDVAVRMISRCSGLGGDESDVVEMLKCRFCE